MAQDTGGSAEFSVSSDDVYQAEIGLLIDQTNMLRRQAATQAAIVKQLHEENQRLQTRVHELLTEVTQSSTPPKS